MSDSSIKVAIKVRPLIKREKEDNLPVQWAVQGNRIVPMDPEMRKRGDGGFQFDHIFDTGVNNNEVFNVVVKPIVDAGVNGFNGTVFAYGQTSSGKTYTMMGTYNEPGIIPLTVEYMFDAISSTVGREFLLRVSYLEIYNEKVNDLLNKEAVDIKLHEDTSGQVLVKCKEEITNSPENVMTIMKKGNKNRRTGETNMNDRSSRSHTIFRITIESREVGAASDGAIQVSQLNLVDLAGSERVRQTGATGERFKEGRHINQSLSTLALVIKQLSELQDNQKFINFRDSKLTRLLQASLGGNAMTTIICAITPVAIEETHCTLSFACRARNIKNKPQLNEVMSDAALLKRYAKQLSKLNEELEKLRQEDRSAEVQEMESKLLEKDRINRSLEQRIELLQTRIVSSDNTRHEESFRCKSRRRRTWGGPSTFKSAALPFQPCKDLTNLPTIKEMSPEQGCNKSIAPVDIMNDSFQIAFTDFELELIESERYRDASRASEDGSDSDDDAPTRRVKFKPVTDNVSVYRPTYDDYPTSPEPKSQPSQTVHCRERSPDTPKVIMRETIQSLRKNIVELSEFTTLEKQLNCEGRCCQHGDELREVAQLKVEMTVLNAEKTNLQCIISELHDKLNQLKNSKEKVTLEASTGEVTCSGKMHCCEDADQQARIRTLESQIEAFTAEKLQYERTSEELLVSKKKIDELENVVSKFASERDELEKVLVSQRESERQQQLTKIADLEERIVDVTKEKAKLKEVTADLNEKLRELEILYESDRKSHEKRILDLEKLVDESASQKIQFEQQTAAFLDKESELQASLEKIAKLENDVASVVADKIKFENEVTKLDGQLKEAFRQNEILKETQAYDLSKVHEKMNEIEAEKLQYERDAADVRAKLEESAHLIAESVEKARSEFRNELEDANRRNEIIKQEHTVETSKLREELERLQSENLEYRNSASSLQEKLKEHEQLSAKFTEEAIDELRAKLEEANLRNQTITADQESKASQLREQTESFEAEKLEYERVLTELRQKQEETTRSNAEHIEVANDLRNKLAEAGRQYLIMKEEQSNETSKLQEQFKNLGSEKLQCECALSDLRDKFDETTSRNFEFKEAISDLRNKLEEAERQKQTLKEERTNAMLSLQEEIQRLSAENVQYLNELREQSKKVAQSNIDSEEKTVNDLCNELEVTDRQNRMIDEATELRELVKDTESEKPQHKRHSNGVHEELRKVHLWNTESVEGVVNSFTHDPEEAGRQHEIVELRANETSVLHEQIKHLESEKLQSESTIVDLRDKLEEITQLKVKPLEETIIELHGQIEHAIRQNEILKQEQSNEMSKLQEEIKNLESEKVHLQSTLADLHNKIEETTQSKIKSLEETISELQGQIEYANQQNEILKQEQSSEMSKLQEEIKNLEVEKVQFESTLADSRNKLEETMQSKIKSLEETITELHGQIKYANQQNEILKQEQSKEVSNLQEEIKCLESEKLQFESTLVDLSNKLEETTQSKVKPLEETISELHGQIEHANQLNGILKQDQANEVLKLQEEIKSLESEKLQLESTLVDLRNKLEETTQSKIKPLQETISELHDQIKYANQQNEILKRDQANEVLKLQEGIKNLESEKLQLESTLVDQRNNLEETIRSKLKSLEETISELNCQIEHANRQNEVLKQEHSIEVSKLQEQFKELVSDKLHHERIVTNLRQNLEQAEEENEKTKQMQAEKILELQSQLESVSVQQQKSEHLLTNSIENLRNEHESDTSSLAGKLQVTLDNSLHEEIVCELRKELEATKSQGELVRKKLTQVILSLQAQFESITSEEISSSKVLNEIDCKRCNEFRECINRLVYKILNAKQVTAELHRTLEDSQAENTLLPRNQNKLQDESETVEKLKQEIVIDLEHENQRADDSTLVNSAEKMNSSGNLTLEQLSFNYVAHGVWDVLKEPFVDDKVLRNLFKTIQRATAEAKFQLQEQAQNEHRRSLTNCELNGNSTAESERRNVSEFTNRIMSDLEEELMKTGVKVEEEGIMEFATTNTCNEDEITMRAPVKDSEKENENIGQLNVKDEFKNISTAMIDDLMSIKVSLEEDNTKLATNLELKILELDEIKSDVQGLKLDIHQLEKTIMLLTTENMEMSTKLNAEKERMRQQESDYQGRIEELYKRISTVTEEKINIENSLTSLNELVDALRSKTPEANDDDIKQKFFEYQGRIDRLMTENIDLSDELTQKAKELEEVKQSKSLLYDHECIYKDKIDGILEKNKEVEEENIKLSNNLIEKLEENDGMREELTILKGKMETLMSANVAENVFASNTNQLQAEICHLRAEIVELKAKVAVLSEENIKLSNNLLQTMDNMDNSDSSQHVRNNNFNLSLIFDDNMSDIATFSHNDDPSEPMSRAAMQEEIEHLRRLNQKLSEMKLTPCTECAHLKEVNKSYRATKVEMRSLTHKLKDLQKKFDRQSADAEALMKVNKDFNQSLCDLSLNASQWETLNVSFVEDKVRSLNKELGTVQDDYNKLRCLYEKKCDEVEKLHAGITTESDHTVEPNVELKAEKLSNKTVRMAKIECDMNDIKLSIGDLKSKFEDVRSVRDSYISETESLLSEMNALKAVREELQQKISENELFIATVTERADILESEVASLTAKIEQCNAVGKQIHNEKLLLEVELDNLRAEKEKKESTLTSVAQKLEIVTKQKMELANSKDIMEHRYKDELNLALKKYEDNVAESEDKLKITEEKLNEYKSENDELKQEIVNFRNVVQNLKDKEEEITRKNMQSHDAQSEIIDKLSKELDKIRKRIIKEITSLKTGKDNLDKLDKPADELFVMFLQVIVQKESEVAKAMRAEYERSRFKLEDQKQQSVDAEKRTMLWAKELENDIEKLQNDIAKHESVCCELKDKCSQLEHLLKESNRENTILRAKIESLETDFNNVQAELEKKSSVDLQKPERLPQEVVSDKELELQAKMSSMEEEYEKRLLEFSSIIETYMMKNKELKTNVDGLEANEEQLKNIINVKSCELSKVTREMQKLMTEWERLTVTHNEVCRDLEGKNSQLTEMSAVVKNKCDLLSEYKMKLDTITPEYEMLKEQVKERKLCLEHCKRDLEALKMESEKEKAAMLDRLNAEEIKSAGLDKLLSTVTNKNKALLSEFDTLQQKNEELGLEIAKLERKIRSSTSKQKAEMKIEELEDRNRTLQCNLDGATNRIGEFQNSKNQLLKELIDLKGQYEILSRENAELKDMLEIQKMKANASNVHDLQGKYYQIVQVKNQIALELEGNKLLLAQRDKEVKKYESQVKELNEKNNELDAELEELADVIREKDGENAVLEDKLNTCLQENAELKDKLMQTCDMADESKNELQNKVSALLQENRMYKSDLVRLCSNSKDVDTRRQNEKLRKDIAQLRKENSELSRKIADLESMCETKNTSGTFKCTSPAFQTSRRRQSRGDAFNERRHLEDILDGDNEAGSNSNSIDILRKKIQELEREIVCKNGKLATLEMQIQSENFPYEKKCKELKEHVLAYRNKNAELCSKITNLERAMNNISRRECDECRRRSTNRKDQYIQTIPVKIQCNGLCSGGIDGKIKKKLEDEKNVWRGLCRSGSRRIKELEEKVKQLETVEDPPVSQEIQPLRDNNAFRQTPSSASSLFAEKGNIDYDKKIKQGMKENLPTNLIGGKSASNYKRRPWNGGP